MIFLRALGWITFVLSLGIGATAIFNATRTYGDAAMVSFFIGVIFLIVGFLLWRKLNTRLS